MKEKSKNINIYQLTTIAMMAYVPVLSRQLQHCIWKAQFRILSFMNIIETAYIHIIVNCVQ